MRKLPLYRSSCLHVVAPIVIGERPVYIHSKTRFEADRAQPAPLEIRTPAR
jgi:hypothetical protein